MFKKLFAATALIGLSATSSFAGLAKLSEDLYAANDDLDNVHRIEYIRKDHEGDVQLKINVKDTEFYVWVNCKEDRIAVAGDDFDGWDYVDHRKMEGWYSDVACERVD